MTPEELAERHPKLYHVTEPDAWPMIKRHGLLSAFAALDLFDVDPVTQKRLTECCRPEAVPIEHTKHGRMVINDNIPMSEKALYKCLDDGLAPR